MLDPSDKNLSLFPIDGWLSNCKLAQETSIMPDPYVSGYMNMPNLGSQSSMKGRRPMHLRIKNYRIRWDL